MSVRLYVGNLPKDVVEKQALVDFFAEAGENATTKVIKDRKTGKCRGFAFVTVPTDEEADAFIEKYNGQSFMDSPLKIEKALPRSKGDDKPAEASNAKGGKRKRSGGGSKKQSSYGDATSAQPDPRWASELEKLKDMLQQQTANV
ncbi:MULTISPECIES: RNA recognition motif domain-containing protein [unclassified Picosynechococcus]|uniref:RNA recognition motif domain-containing protein n=1 Tax=unclassified Picosynechococcus TaxID=3079910 RepID=UPI0004AB1845|nr:MULTISPECIES: RNA-binding protein [unclassified Picosynechococcus]AMA08994.1 RNA-binding protein [Picosynechococcus sp. PCC 73109]